MANRRRSAPPVMVTTATTWDERRVISPTVTPRSILLNPLVASGNTHHDQSAPSTPEQSTPQHDRSDLVPGSTPTACSSASSFGDGTALPDGTTSTDLTEIKPQPKHFDPVSLPEDVFHLILDKLDMETLAAAQQVSHTWRQVIRTNGSLWRQVCIDNRVRPEDIKELDKLSARRRKRVDGPWLVSYGRRNDHQSVWRLLCSDRYPGIRDWNTGHCTTWDSSTTPPLRCALSIPDLDGIICVEAEMGAACVASGPARVYQRSLVPRPNYLAATFTRLGDTVSSVATVGKWVAVARWSAGHHGPWPLDKPTSLVLYSMLPIPKRAPYVKGSALDVQAPRGLLQYVSHVKLPTVWGYDVQLVNGKRGAMLALLCCPARMSGPGHWVSTLADYQVHIWYLDEWLFPGAPAHTIVKVPDGVKARNMCFTEDYIFVPNGRYIVVLKIGSERYKSFPTTPYGAALATAVSLLNPKNYPPNMRTLYELPFVSEGATWSDAHMLACIGVHRRSLGPNPIYTGTSRCAEIATTNSDLVYATGGGSLVVIKDYRTVMAKVFESMEAWRVASDNSLLIACWPHVGVVRTCGDRIVAQSRNFNNLLLLDASTLPTPNGVGRTYPPEQREYYLSISSHNASSFQARYNMPSTVPRGVRREEDSDKPPCTLQFRRAQIKNAGELLPGALTPSSLFIPLHSPATTRVYVPPRDHRDTHPSMRVFQWGRPALSLGAMGLGPA